MKLTQGATFKFSLEATNTSWTQGTMAEAKEAARAWDGRCAHGKRNFSSFSFQLSPDLVPHLLLADEHKMWFSMLAWHRLMHVFKCDTKFLRNMVKNGAIGINYCEQLLNDLLKGRAFQGSRRDRTHTFYIFQHEDDLPEPTNEWTIRTINDDDMHDPLSVTEFLERVEPLEISAYRFSDYITAIRVPGEDTGAPVRPAIEIGYGLGWHSLSIKAIGLVGDVAVASPKRWGKHVKDAAGLQDAAAEFMEKAELICSELKSPEATLDDIVARFLRCCRTRRVWIWHREPTIDCWIRQPTTDLVELVGAMADYFTTLDDPDQSSRLEKVFYDLLSGPVGGLTDNDWREAKDYLGMPRQVDPAESGARTLKSP